MRSRHLKKAAVFITLASLSALGGCDRLGMMGRQQYVMSVYNDTAELTESGRAWGEAIGPWLQGGKADVAAIEAAAAKLNPTVKAVRAKLQTRTVPNDATSQEFSQLVDEYLDWQIEANNKLASWTDVVREENPGSPSTCRRIADELLALNGEEMMWKMRIGRLGEKLGVRMAQQ
ncbi:MAG: hypothetical protein RIC55_32725 [Pirellulaceae bacterium]